MIKNAMWVRFSVSSIGILDNKKCPPAQTGMNNS